MVISLLFRQIGTVAGLKNIPLNWNSTVTANNQMFGHFNKPNTQSDEAPLLTVNQGIWCYSTRPNTPRRNIRLYGNRHDGSLLEEGVFVYIKSVQIKDIPSTCLLGSKNTVMEKSGLIKEGETITYGPAGAAFDENWTARITKGHPYYPYDEKTNSSSSEAHSEIAQALFFYENMQGEGTRQSAEQRPGIHRKG